MTPFLPFTHSPGPASCRTSGLAMAGTSPAMTRISVMVLEALGQFLDIFRRPAGNFHAEMQTHLHQHFFDFVERLSAEVLRAQHFGFGLLNEVADIDDVVVLQTVGRTPREFELVDLLEEGRVEGEIWDRLVRGFALRLLEVHEYVELILQNARGISERVFGA